MPRYIAIEKVTGRVYGDTARFGGAVDVGSPADAVLLFDRYLGRAPRGFGHAGRTSPAASYDVFEVSRSGPATASEAEAQALVNEHGSWVVALVTYNS